MVKVSVIVSPRDKVENESSRDIELVSDFNDASGEYVYFKNTEDDLDSEKILSASGDLVVFNSNEDETIEEFRNSFEEFWQDILGADFEFTLNLIGKLDWDVMIKKSMLCRKSPKETDIGQAIETYNEIFQKFIDRNMMKEYMKYLYDVKVEELLKLYEISPNEDSYNLLRQDFMQMVYHKRFTEFSVYTTILNKLFFDNVVYSKNYRKFKELMEDYYIRVDMFYLNEDIREIRMQNKRIKQQTEMLNRMNNEIINSRSWKLTRPLRAMK